MTNGGRRAGAGRKKGSFARHTLEAQEAKKKITDMVSAEIVPIIQAQIKKAKKGNTLAFKELADRAYGKPKQSLVGDEDGPIELRILWGAPKK